MRSGRLQMNFMSNLNFFEFFLSFLVFRQFSARGAWFFYFLVLLYSSRIIFFFYAVYARARLPPTTTLPRSLVVRHQHDRQEAARLRHHAVRQRLRPARRHGRRPPSAAAAVNAICAARAARRSRCTSRAVAHSVTGIEVHTPSSVSFSRRWWMLILTLVTSRFVAMQLGAQAAVQAAVHLVQALSLRSGAVHLAQRPRR